MELKIIFVGNNTLIGRYEKETETLHEPRAIAFGTDPQNRPIIGIQILVGNPDSLELLNPSLMYDIKDESITSLYIKATSNIDIVKNLSNIRPIRG